MQRVFTLDAAVFLHLQTVGGILLVFLGRITRHARKAAVFAFGAFEGNHNAIVFTFCHF